MDTYEIELEAAEPDGFADKIALVPHTSLGLRRHCVSASQPSRDVGLGDSAA